MWFIFSGKAPPNLAQGVPPLLASQYIMGPGGLLPAYPVSVWLLCFHIQEVNHQHLTCFGVHNTLVMSLLCNLTYILYDLFYP